MKTDSPLEHLPSKPTGLSLNLDLTTSDLHSNITRNKSSSSSTGGSIAGKMSIGKGLVLIAPTTSTSSFTNLINTHKRAGSTGTTGTGDESYTTTDDEAEENHDHEEDEVDCSIKDHVTSKLFDTSSEFDMYSDIATIADKVAPASSGGAVSPAESKRHLPIVHRNSSDSSVYSDLGLDKCEDMDLESMCGTESSSNWNKSVIVNSDTMTNLQNELRKARDDIKLKDEEVGRLSRIRQDVETELEDLTASLFQEAHNMVREANEKQATAEKSLRESQMKVDVLSAEVSALKTLVLTSTPSRPNPHLHPQIGGGSSKDDGGCNMKKHRRCPSHFNLKYGRENSPPDSPEKEFNPIVNSAEVNVSDGFEVDPIVHEEFLEWKRNPTLDKSSSEFIRRIYREDIDLCLRFNNKELSAKVIGTVENGSILVEAVGDKSKTMFPKKCALMEVSRQCYYRMNIGDPDTWHFISMICRNRIISVCDFLNYLKYIERGLVKSTVHDIYWEIARLRKDMVLARLGLSISSS